MDSEKVAERTQRYRSPIRKVLDAPAGKIFISRESSVVILFRDFLSHSEALG